MTISDRISSAVHDAIRRGVEPASLYLGVTDYRELKDFIAPMLRYPVKAEVNFKGEVYMGMRVYRVFEPSHVGVA